MVDLASLLSLGLVSSVPLMLASLGEALLERSGRINLGVEGLMAVGAASGVVAGIWSGSPVLGLILGGLAAVALSTLYILPVIVYGADQVVVGLVVFFSGIALADIVGAGAGGLPSPPFKHGYFMVLASILLGLVAWLILDKTWVGVEIRALGESEEYSRLRGLRAVMLRSMIAAVAAFLAGVAGAFMSLALHNGRWYPGLTAGWGWIAIGLVILGYWNPVGVVVASILTGVLMASRTLLAALGLEESLADMIPYISVLTALVVVSLAASRRGARPPSLVWRLE